ncbi:MAG: hypothetical protein JST31_12735 [Actinobacteria bacterium]|nr:hypothetical protein [Actinomycetota bacterium]
MSGLLGGVWDFVVGDDWTLALAVVLALGLTALAVAAGLAAWWVAPVVVPLFLLASIRRALRSRG